jgi:hypothetical protein
MRRTGEDESETWDETMFQSCCRVNQVWIGRTPTRALAKEYPGGDHVEGARRAQLEF